MMGQEKWRQARDELKTWVKSDRARFLPLLIEANLGLARKMLAAGQAGDARQVLTYLATIAPPETMRGIELEFALKGGPSESSFPHFFSTLAAGAALSPAERIRHADTLVLAFRLPSAREASTPEAIRLAAELAAIQEAMQALSLSRFEAVAEALRRVPLRSPFGHWAVFVKGLACFHTGDSHRAAKLWHSLPPGSVPAKTSRSYLLLIPDESAGDSDAAHSSPAVLEGALRIISGKEADTLHRAELLWGQNKLVESYRVVRQGLSDFPSLGGGLRGALTEFYFNVPAQREDQPRSDFLDFIDEKIALGRDLSPTEEMLSYRILLLLSKDELTPSLLEDDAKKYLKLRTQLKGTNDALASLLYSFLGQHFARPVLERYSFRKPMMAAPKNAIAAFQRSIEYNPANLDAYLGLCLVYEKQDQKSERNRLLDQMTVRFPDDKQVLVLTAKGCLGRKAFQKAFDYLLRARQLDPLDSGISELIVEAQLGSARTHYQKKAPAKARQVFANLSETFTGKPDDPKRSRWSILARQAAYEGLWGSKDESDSLLAQSLRLAPSPAGALLLAHLNYRAYAAYNRFDTPFLLALKSALKGSLRLPEIALFIRIVDVAMETWEHLGTDNEQKFVDDANKRAAKGSFERAEVLDFITQLRGHDLFGHFVGPILHKALKQAPHDPCFRLWRFKLGKFISSSRGEDHAELQSIADEAAHRQDEATRREALELLRKNGKEASPGSPPPMPFQDFEADDEGDDEGEETESLPSPIPDLNSLPPGFVQTILNATPEEIARVREQFRDRMDVSAFDLLVAAIKKSGPSKFGPSVKANPKKAPKNAPPKPEIILVPPAPKTIQPDLF